MLQVINWKTALNIPREANLSPAAADIIQHLCCDASVRLGKNGAGEVKAHPFFHDIAFEGLRQQEAPHIPTIRGQLDTSNFDPVDPEKLRDDSVRKDHLSDNGKHSEHAFFEFTFRRFFDDVGHLIAPKMIDVDVDVEQDNSPVYVWQDVLLGKKLQAFHMDSTYVCVCDVSFRWLADISP